MIVYKYINVYNSAGREGHESRSYISTIKLPDSKESDSNCKVKFDKITYPYIYLKKKKKKFSIYKILVEKIQL